MNIKDIVLGIAIFLLTLFVGMYGIRTLYSSQPQYDMYCKQINTPEQCTEAGGVWYINSGVPQTMPAEKAASVPNGYCQYDYQKCQNDYDHANEVYRQKIFYTAIPLGILIIAAGLIFFSLEAVGAGLMAGGVGVMIYGIGGYWRWTAEFLRFLISLIGLVIVIWLAYYAQRRWGKKDKKR